jgi:conjugal transfer pilus assembly protein TraW
VKYKLLSFYTFVFLAFPLGVQAITELEPVGAVYPVVEPDVRIELKAKAIAQWEQQKKKYQERISTYQPANLQPLPKAEQDRSFSVDMTYILDRDLTDKDGKVLYSRGYQFNPLDYMSFTLGLVVIDGNDPVQVKWFKESPYSSNHRMKLVLSGGYAQPLITELNRAVYYLDKEVVARFHLAAVPCVAVQQDKHIQVTEFLLEEDQ